MNGSGLGGAAGRRQGRGPVRARVRPGRVQHRGRLRLQHGRCAPRLSFPVRPAACSAPQSREAAAGPAAARRRRWRRGRAAARWPEQTSPTPTTTRAPETRTAMRRRKPDPRVGLPASIPSGARESLAHPARPPSSRGENAVTDPRRRGPVRRPPRSDLLRVPAVPGRGSDGEQGPQRLQHLVRPRQARDRYADRCVARADRARTRWRAERPPAAAEEGGLLEERAVWLILTAFDRQVLSLTPLLLRCPQNRGPRVVWTGSRL